jgi:hypothetical protein
MRELALLLLVCPLAALADAQPARFSAGGYYRIMTRPDFEGSDSRLGIWNLSGRLLNEGPYGMLEMQLAVLQGDAARAEPFANVYARIEGGAFSRADTGNGSLANFSVTGLYVEAGNLFLDRVRFRIGTLDYYPGDLGLYDLRPVWIFNDTLGVSAFYRGDWLDLLAGVGDAGYGIRGAQYDTIFSGGVWAKARIDPGFEVGLGAQGLYEPSISGNRNAPYATPGIDYSDYLRHEVTQHYFLDNPTEVRLPQPQARSSASWKVFGYLGFGKLGPLRWSSLYGHVTKKHPQNYSTETYQGQTYTLYLHDLTDRQTEVQVGNEMLLTLWPDLLDMAWGVLYGRNINSANSVGAGEDNRLYASTVLRLQAYATSTVHFLFESSLAQEKSLNGNLYREHVDSVFSSTDGLSDPRGLQFGDSDTRNTWQGKAGIVFNPSGRGIYARPSLRLLYGLQYSNAQAAYANTFSTSLAQDQEFPQPTERHWHSVVALEAEGWF